MVKSERGRFTYGGGRNRVACDYLKYANPPPQTKIAARAFSKKRALYSGVALNKLVNRAVNFNDTTWRVSWTSIQR